MAIDALDECPKEELNQLISILNDLISMTSSSLSPIRFLFTSRPISEALDLIQKFHNISRPYNIDEEPGTTDDILKFIQKKLELTSLQEMVAEVAKVSETSFECAALLCRELTTNHSGQVTKTGFKKIISQLHQLPGMKLYGSYYAILCMHITDKDDLQFFHQLMAWVLLVHSPQPRQVFTAIAAVLHPGQETDVDVIFSWLSSFLHGAAREDSAAITPHHTSFRDFLLDQEASKEFFIDITSQTKHLELALGCLKIMNAKPDGLMFNICELPTSDALNEDSPDSKKERVSEHISPGLQYACCSIAYHFQQMMHASHTSNEQTSTVEIDSIACMASACNACRSLVSITRYLYHGLKTVSPRFCL